HTRLQGDWSSDVCSSDLPQLYKIKTETGYVVGSLEQAFVDKLSEEVSAFLLGGQAWTVVHVNHQERTVVVALAPRGMKPSWSGRSEERRVGKECRCG